MQMIAYPAQFTVEPEGGYTITFRDIPEAITYGEDEDDALLMALDALETVFAHKIRDNEIIHKPSETLEGEHLVCIPPMIAAKLVIYWEMKQQNVRKSALARRLNWNNPQIERMLDLKHESKMSNLMTVLAALGKELMVSVR